MSTGGYSQHRNSISPTAMMRLETALELAHGYLLQLAPVTHRAVIAGSVRRGLRQVGDIEIVVQPRMIADGLFGEQRPDTEAILAVARRLGEVTKAGDRYIRVEAPYFRTPGHLETVGVDIYMVHPPAQWGCILAIRTGPARLGRWAMQCLARRGYVHRDGAIWRRTGRHERSFNGEWREVLEPVEVPDEETFFRIAGLPCLPPSRRGTRAAFRPLSEEV